MKNVKLTIDKDKMFSRKGAEGAEKKNVKLKMKNVKLAMVKDKMFSRKGAEKRK